MSAEQAKGTTVGAGVERLRGELRETVDLIRRSGGGLVFETFPGALQEAPPSDAPIGGGDATGVRRVAPDAVATAHRALIDAADALAETLAQLDSTGWRVHPLRFP